MIFVVGVFLVVFFGRKDLIFIEDEVEIEVAKGGSGQLCGG